MADSALPWAELLVDLVAVLAWPLAILTIALWLRGEIRQGASSAVARIAELGWMKLTWPGGFSLEGKFGDIVKKRADILRQDPPIEADRTANLPTSISVGSPRAMIVESYEAVQGALAQAARASGMSDSDVIINDSRVLAARLQGAGLVSADVADGVSILDDVRQAALTTVGPGPTAGQAADYLRLAQAVLERIPVDR